MRSYAIVLIFTLACFGGCGKALENGAASQLENSNESTDIERPPDEAAISAVKTMLDAWVIGDSVGRFKREHPNYRLWEADWVVGKMLSRYEIGPTKIVDDNPQIGSIVDVQVTLVYLSKAGTEIKRSVVYETSYSPPVAGLDDVWHIYNWALSSRF